MDFNLFFFKTYWDVVGNNVWRLVKDAFGNRSLAETLIVLIPKQDHPATMKHFRPIGLCNVLYKFITKVLVLFIWSNNDSRRGIHLVNWTVLSRSFEEMGVLVFGTQDYQMFVSCLGTYSIAWISCGLVSSSINT